MRAQFTQPLELNSKQLLNELAAAGINSDVPNIDHDNNFWLNINEGDIEKAALIIAAHKGITNTDDSNKL